MSLDQSLTYIEGVDHPDVAAGQWWCRVLLLVTLQQVAELAGTTGCQRMLCVVVGAHYCLVACGV